MVLERLLDGQNGVVVGRASDFAFKNRNDAVRIFLCGDKDSRIKRIMDKHGISESKAKSIVDWRLMPSEEAIMTITQERTGDIQDIMTCALMRRSSAWTVSWRWFQRI